MCYGSLSQVVCSSAVRRDFVSDDRQNPPNGGTTSRSGAVGLDKREGNFHRINSGRLPFPFIPMAQKLGEYEPLLKDAIELFGIRRNTSP